MQVTRKAHFLLLKFLFAGCLLSSFFASGKTIYVKPNGNDAATGNSWANAYQTLQHAINAAAAADEVWVAAGTYKPTTTTDRTIAFTLKNNIAIYGGFAGTETLLNQRNHTANETILSGDIGVPNNSSDNSFRVVAGTDLGNSTLLDGFTITGGNANADPYTRGGGLYLLRSSLTVARCTLKANHAMNGGGILNIGGAAPVFYDCRVTGNTATFNGGGILNDQSNATLDNCLVSGNFASSGGGLANYLINPVIRNTVFMGNQASGTGGAMYNLSSSPTIINCSFSGNIAPNTGGGVFYNLSTADLFSSPVLTNCIIWGNSSIFGLTTQLTTISYSIIQGGYEGTGNLNLNPRFINQPTVGLGTSGDLRVQPCSRAVNAGLNSANTTQLDLDGNPRIALGTIDIGAYEIQTQPDCCPAGNVLYVNGNAAGSNNGHNWANALTSLAEALQKSELCPLVTEIWVAAGTYTPTTGTDRNVSFSMRNGIGLYGGFSGTETLLNQRNLEANRVILSGDIGAVNDRNDNSYHIFSNSNIGPTAILDGFTLTGGNANGNINQGSIGAAILNYTGANPTIRNCTFSGNSAEYGAMANVFNSVPAIINCTFTGNLAYRGAAIYNFGSSPSIINCSFSGNQGTSGWSVMLNSASSALPSNPTITNCIFWGNAGGIFLNFSSTPAISYSIVQGGHVGTANLDVNPLFVNQPPIGLGNTGDLRLQLCSPAINVGNNAANISATDLAGKPRIARVTIDMGAYEQQQVPPPPIGYFTTIQQLPLNGSVILPADCGPFAELQSTGPRPISGTLTARLFVDDSPPTLKEKSFVARHFEIMPENNGFTGSGRIILYFAQADFDLFNNVADSDVKLPAFPDDQAGKNHLRIYKFAGPSVIGIPQFYEMGVTEIDPSNFDILWNETAQRWEVSVLVSGFGGLFAGASSISVLCSETEYQWHAATQGSTYQWQKLQNGSWINLEDPDVFPFTNSSVLFCTTSITADWYGTRIRCLVNGTTPGPVYTIQFATTWTGSLDNAWNKAGNWSCGIIPNEKTDVIVTNNVLTYPQIPANTAVRSLNIQPGCNVTITPGVHFRIAGQ